MTKLRDNLFFLVFIGGIFSGWQLLSFAGYGVKISDLTIGGIILLFFKKVFIDAKEIKVARLNMTVLILISIGIWTISGFYPFLNGYSYGITQFFKTSVHLYFYLIFTFAIFVDPPEIKVLRNILLVFIVLALPINIFGIYQLFARLYDLPFAFLNYNNVSFLSRSEVTGAGETGVMQLALQFGNFYRATSIFSEPSGLAAFNLNALMFLFVPKLLKIEPIVKNRLLFISIAVFSVLGLFLTFSLTGVFNMAVVFFLLFLIVPGRFTRYFLWTVPVAAILIFTADLLVVRYFDISLLDLFQTRITSIATKGAGAEAITGESFWKRFDTMVKAVDVWMLSPVIGVGLGQTGFFYHMTGYVYFDSTVAAMLAETGIISATIFVIWFFIWIRKSFLQILDSELQKKASVGLQQLIALKYVFISLIFVNAAFTSNILVTENLWIWVAFFLVVEYRILELKGGRFFKIRFMKKSLAQLLHIGNKD